MKLFGITIGKEDTSKKPKQDNTQLMRKVAKIVGKIKLFVVLIIFLGSIVYMLTQISKYSTAEPTDDQITEATSGVKKVRIKAEDITRIEALKETNVEVKSIIEENRTNPFK